MLGVPPPCAPARPGSPGEEGDGAELKFFRIPLVALLIISVEFRLSATPGIGDLGPPPTGAVLDNNPPSVESKIRFNLLAPSDTSNGWADAPIVLLIALPEGALVDSNPLTCSDDALLSSFVPGFLNFLTAKEGDLETGLPSSPPELALASLLFPSFTGIRGAILFQFYCNDMIKCGGPPKKMQS